MIKIDKRLTDKYVRLASISKRKRINYNFHAEPGDTLQRMLNVLNKGTYVQPHKHEQPDKREAFIILAGKVLVAEFDDTGKTTGHILLCRDTGDYGCEISPGVWHTIICMEDGSVLYELKDGPYDEKTDKKFASWAPTEGDKSCMGYNEGIIKKTIPGNSIL